MATAIETTVFDKSREMENRASAHLTSGSFGVILLRTMKVVEIVKNDIVEIVRNRPSYPFLSGFIRGAGTLVINNRGIALTLEHESETVMNCVLDAIVSMGFSDSYDVVSVKPEYAIAEKSVKAELSTELSSEVLKKTRIVDGFEIISGIDPSMCGTEREKADYIRGIFLASGKVYIPDVEAKNRRGYHLEISLWSAKVAEDIVAILAERGVKASVVERKHDEKRGSSIHGVSVYIKDKDMISDFLAVCDSSKAVMRLQEIILERGMRNQINRSNNCSMANVDKTVRAVSETVMAIKKIERTVGLETLPKQLYETAVARLENPELSMNELISEIPDRPSKSGLQHRLDKLKKIAEELD